jgi:beta-glucosidase-like glycosyl hydrolase
LYGSVNRDACLTARSGMTGSRAKMRGAPLFVLAGAAHALLPPPLPLICEPTVIHGCYNDSWTRTFPHMASNGGPDDPFGGNATLETCAYLCATSSPPYAVAAIENGGQCFCASAEDLARAAPNRTADAECNAPCNGNALATCGGAWRAWAYDFACAKYSPSAMPWQNWSLPHAARVADLVGRLSPVGLVGQLLQNGIDYYSAGVQLPRYIVSQECLAGFDGGGIFLAPPVPTLASSGFPQPVNMGNSWDVELVRELASAISDEARAAFNLGRPSLTCMSPNLNVNRDPRWGRNIESFSEDPQLLAALGVAYITGLQQGLPANASAAASGYLKVFAVPKHLGAYSVECYNRSGATNYPLCEVYRNTYDAAVDELDLRETYFPGWEAAVREANAQGVMCSYNEINGVPACGNGAVLRDVLEGEWGLDGLVISDAGAVAYIGIREDDYPLTRGHGFAATPLEAALSAFRNGTTVSLEDTSDADSALFATYLRPALAAGNVTLDELRTAAARALLPRFRVGLYDPPERNPWNAIPASVLESPAHHALARRAAAETFVLLKNDNGLLPFQPVGAGGGPARIALVGPTSNCSACGVNRYSGHPASTVGILDGLSAAAAAAGARVEFGGEALNAAAIATLAGADAGVVVLTGTGEGESHDRFSVTFPDATLAWLVQLAAAQAQAGSQFPPLVLLVASGGAVDSSPALPLFGAALALYTGGMDYGAAVGDVLFGAAEPGGALAHTVYKESWTNASDFLSMAVRAPPGRGHRYLLPAAAQQHVLFPFGHGLSFTSWAAAIDGITPLQPATIARSQLEAGANVSVAVRLTNTGSARAGSRVSFVLLQRQNADPLEQWPVQWLPRSGFAKAHRVAPGETVQLALTLVARDFSRWDAAQQRYVVRPGAFALALRDGGGGSAAIINVTDA